MQNCHMLSYVDLKVAFCFAVINSAAAITLKTINNAKVDFFGKYVFKIKMFDNFIWRFENDF